MSKKATTETPKQTPAQKITELLKPFTSYKKAPAKDRDAKRKDDLLALLSKKAAVKASLNKALDSACKEIEAEVKAIHDKDTKALEKAGISLQKKPRKKKASTS